MAFSYTARPDKSDRDWVRWRIGDTDPEDVWQEDSEIDGALALASSKEEAAIACIDSVLAKWARWVDSRDANLEFKYSQRVESLLKVREQIEDGMSAILLGPPWMASHSISRKEEAESDDDRVSPSFELGMHDFPENETTSS